jgi:GMP synthase (glutamine-hydrolysing)
LGKSRELFSKKLRQQLCPTRFTPYELIENSPMIYFIQHEHESPPGTAIEWCNRRNRDFRIINLHLREDLPHNISSHDHVIICGGDMNVDEEHLYPWLRAEKKFIELCLEKSVKILGICLGGQLLAGVLGARVGPAPFWEVGWHLVKFEHLPKFPEEFEMFQWHGYSFDTPKGAIRIASNAICQDQGFIYKNSAIGIQFHPESTVDWIKSCADATNYPEGPYVQGRQDIYHQMTKQEPLAKWFNDFLDYFVKL